MSPNKTAFEQQQTNAFYPDGIQNHYWQQTRSKIIFNQLKTHNLHNLKFMEVGCGRGHVVEALSYKNIDITGVELAEVTPFGSVKDKIYSGQSFSEIPEAQRKEYAGILLLDVIEHIEDPFQFIKEIYFDYPNVNYLFITVPAMKKIWSNYDEYINHYKRYELSDLPELAHKTNSEIINSGYFFHILYPAARLLLNIKNERTLSIKAPQGPARFIHSALAQFLYFEYKLCPKNIPGTSLFCILKRLHP